MQLDQLSVAIQTLYRDVSPAGHIDWRPLCLRMLMNAGRLTFRTGVRQLAEYGLARKAALDNVSNGNRLLVEMDFSGTRIVRQSAVAAEKTTCTPDRDASVLAAIR